MSESPTGTGPQPALKSTCVILASWAVTAKWCTDPVTSQKWIFSRSGGQKSETKLCVSLISPMGSVFSLQKGIWESSYIQIAFCCPVSSSWRDLSPFESVRISPSWPPLTLISALKAQSTKAVTQGLQHRSFRRQVSSHNKNKVPVGFYNNFLPLPWDSQKRKAPAHFLPRADWNVQRKRRR